MDLQKDILKPYLNLIKHARQTIELVLICICVWCETNLKFVLIFKPRGSWNKLDCRN